MARKKIGALLEEKGYITEFQLVAALSHQRKWKSKLGQSLIELGYLEENQLYEVLAEQLGMQFIDPRKITISPEIMKYASKELARDWYSVPIAFNGQTWTVATSDPLKPGLANKLGLHLKGPVDFVLATTLAIENLGRKIADKVPVATVQPVKKAFVKDENGGFTPVQPPPQPAPAKPQSDDDLFLSAPAAPEAGPENIEVALQEFSGPAPEPVQEAVPAAPAQDEPMGAPEVPNLDAAFMEQAPEPGIPAPSAPEPGPEAAAVELPPDAFMEIEHEREPDLSEPAPLSDADEIPLEAAHESAAAIPAEEPKESTDMIDLDELLPPPTDEPVPTAGGEEAPTDLGTPSLMETTAEPEPLFEAPPLEMPQADSVGQELEALPTEEPAAAMDEIIEPSSLEEVQTFEAPPMEAPLMEAPAMEQDQAEPAGPEASVPDLGGLELGAPPSFESGAEESLQVPSLDSILAGVTGTAPGPEPPSTEVESATPFEAPPLEVPADSAAPEQIVDAAGETSEEIETLNDSVTEEITDEAVPMAPGQPEESAPEEAGSAEEESSQEIMDKISLLEQQIKGMTDMLSGFKDTLKEKKGKPKDQK